MVLDKRPCFSIIFLSIPLPRQARAVSLPQFYESLSFDFFMSEKYPNTDTAKALIASTIMSFIVSANASCPTSGVPSLNANFCIFNDNNESKVNSYISHIAPADNAKQNANKDTKNGLRTNLTCFALLRKLTKAKPKSPSIAPLKACNTVSQ